MKAHASHGLGIVVIIALGIPWHGSDAGQGAHVPSDLIAQVQPDSPAGPPGPAVLSLTQTTTTSTGQSLEFPSPSF